MEEAAKDVGGCETIRLQRETIRLQRETIIYQEFVIRARDLEIQGMREMIQAALENNRALDYEYDDNNTKSRSKAAPSTLRLRPFANAATST